MNCSPIEHLRSFVAGVPALNASFNRCLQNWGAEVPPDTIIFAEVGDAIAENLAALSPELRQEIFTGIEAGVVSQNAALSTAMATGLVEALVTRADKRPELWLEIEKLLGAASKKHAVA